MGRLVTTHSTYVAGVIKKLRALAMCDEIKTITPGAINRAKGNSQRLNIKVTTKIRGGYKLIARKGKSVQEIFVVTDISLLEMEAKIKEVMEI